MGSTSVDVNVERLKTKIDYLVWERYSRKHPRVNWPGIISRIVWPEEFDAAVLRPLVVQKGIAMLSRGMWHEGLEEAAMQKVLEEQPHDGRPDNIDAVQGKMVAAIQEEICDYDNKKELLGGDAHMCHLDVEKMHAEFLLSLYFEILMQENSAVEMEEGREVGGGGSLE